jgi:hypothetical protein
MHLEMEAQRVNIAFSETPSEAVVNLTMKI